MVILGEKDRSNIDKVFVNLQDIITRRRAIITELRKVARKGDHYLRIPDVGMVKIQNGNNIDIQNRKGFILEYLNIGDYRGDIIELTYILKGLGSISKNIKNYILELKLVDNKAIIDVFMKTGDISKTIQTTAKNISIINQHITNLRRLILGR